MARRLIALALVIASGVWLAVPMRASGRAAPAAATVLAAFDDLARRPAVAWTADRRLEGELVDKGERGWLEVRSEFDGRRTLTHTILAEGGSERIRHRALHKVLEKEVEGARQNATHRAAFSTDNYRYRLVDTPWELVRIELTPRREDTQLVDGHAVVDPETGDLLKVEGRLARNPSFWVRDVHVERTYARVAGANLLVELRSTARVRFVGAARLRIQTTYRTVDGRPVGAAPETLLTARP